MLPGGFPHFTEAKPPCSPTRNKFQRLRHKIGSSGMIAAVEQHIGIGSAAVGYQITR